MMKAVDYMKVEFFGGPLDGSTRVIGRNIKNIQVPIKRGVLEVDRYPVPNKAIFKAYNYKLGENMKEVAL